MFELYHMMSVVGPEASLTPSISVRMGMHHGITAQLPTGSCSMYNPFQEYQPTFHTQDYTGMEEHVQPLSVVYFDMASLFD